MLELGNTATDYEPYGYKIPFVNRGKNLIPYPYATTTKTENGVTFTDNGDGSITANGTATGASQYFLKFSPDYFKLDKNATYILSGCPSGGTLTTYRIEFFLYQGNTQLLYKRDTGNGVIINNIPENYDIVTIKIMVYSGTTVNNLVFRPQLELGNTATDYEPYRAPDTTNVYHTAQLKDGESISYKADDLPELQLYKGENNITADTAVAPSAIDIKYLN